MSFLHSIPINKTQYTNRLLYNSCIFLCLCSVKLTENGKTALLQLAGGDMRRVLNLLQATHLSYEEVDEEVVYLTAGAAVPRVIEHMFQSLMNDSFLQAYNTINQVRIYMFIRIYPRYLFYWTFVLPLLGLLGFGRVFWTTAMLCATSARRWRLW